MSNYDLKIPEEVSDHKYYDDWRVFHKKNPEVLKEVVYQIRKLKHSGKQRASVKTILGVVRHDFSIKIQGTEEFRINDKFTSIYGNIIKANYPNLASMIETRRLRAKAMVYAE